MAEYLIDDFVSPQVKTTVDALTKSVDNLVVSIDKLNNAGAGGGGGGKGGGGKTKAVTDLEIALKRLEKVEQELRIATSEDTRLTVANINAKKTELSLIQKKSGYMNMLEAEVKRLTAAYHQLSTREEVYGTTGRKIMTELKGKREELAKLRAEYGDSTMRVGEYSRANNGLRLSIGMIAGELPNAALGARIFIMSLSNNFQGLINAISAAKAEHKQLMQQFADGAITKKPISVFSQILKQVFSLQVGLMVLVALFTAFGESMWKFAKDFFKAADAIDTTTKTLSEYLKVMKEAQGASYDKTKRIVQLGIEIKKFGGNVEDAKKIVKDFNKEFKTNYETIEEVAKAYDKLGKNAILSAMKQQAALEYISKGSKAIMKMQAADETIGSFSKKEQAKAINDYNEYFKTLEDILRRAGKSESEIIKKKNEIQREVIEKGFLDPSTLRKNLPDSEKLQVGLAGALGLDDKQLGKAISNRDKFLMKAIATRSRLRVEIKGTLKDAETLLQFEGDDDKDTGAGGREKAFREIFEKAYHYNVEIGKLIVEREKLETEVTRETKEGYINSFEERIKAAKKLEEVNKKIAELKLIDDKKNLEETAEAERIAARKIHERNVENNVDVEKSKEQLKTALLTIQKNLDLKQIELTHKTLNETLNLEKEHAKNLKSIWDDSFNDFVIIQEAKLELEKMQDEAELKRALRDVDSPINGVLGKVGINTGLGNQMKKTALSGENQLKTARKEIAANEEKLAEAKRYLEVLKETNQETGEQTAKVKELEDALKKQAEQYPKIEEAVKEMNIDEAINLANEVILSSTQQMVDSMKGIWNEYYEFQQDKLDEQLKTFTKINDESLKNVEDMEKAGVLSKQEAADEKKRINAYQQSQEEQIARDKAKLEREAFLQKQAFGLAEVWINYGITQSALMAAKAELDALSAGILGMPYYVFASAMNLSGALGATALIAAQTIPMFAEGGTMDHTGMAILGDGGKQELVRTPSGDLFITPNVPTMYKLDKGAQIYPDAAKADINRIMGMSVAGSMNMSNDELIKEMQKTNYLLKKQKPAMFNGMSLIEQIKFGDRISQRKRGLFN